jgi:hypothetical protein
VLALRQAIITGIALPLRMQRPPNCSQNADIADDVRGVQVPSFRQVYLETFQSRDDLLDAALASSHIPFLLDWQPTARAAGKRFIGGRLVCN